MLVELEQLGTQDLCNRRVNVINCAHWLRRSVLRRVPWTPSLRRAQRPGRSQRPRRWRP